MNIYGLQKMTLLDYPGRVACTVFLGGCDMRCPWCHNSELVNMTAEPVMTDAELMTFLEGRKKLLDGVAVTGGEPLLREENLELIRNISGMGYPVKLDTNGTHPDRLRRAVEAGWVQYVAMDIKNSPDLYARTVGLTAVDLSAVRKSVSYLLEGNVPYEFRTTVVKEFHDEASMRAIGEWISGAEKYFLQKFTDRETVAFAGFHAPDEADMAKWVGFLRQNVKEVEIRG